MPSNSFLKPWMLRKKEEVLFWTGVAIYTNAKNEQPFYTTGYVLIVMFVPARQQRCCGTNIVSCYISEVKSTKLHVSTYA
jgi:hypothetical protein